MVKKAKKSVNRKVDIEIKPDITNQEIKSSLEINKSLSDRVALFITDAFGSIKFLCICLLVFLIWITWNLGLLPPLKPFDPYPFATLDMIVSLFAIFLSVSVLISQNRQGRLDKIRQQVEFEVNVRAENEITKVLNMLHEIQKKIGINKNDTELEIMKENIDLQQLHQIVHDTEKKED
jgi:uncharacterized membrane protein